jgi:hypothetical protein
MPKNVLENRIEMLKDASRRLLQLLNDGHQSLMWMVAVRQVTDEIQDIMEGRQD